MWMWETHTHTFHQLLSPLRAPNTRLERCRWTGRGVRSQWAVFEVCVGCCPAGSLSTDTHTHTHSLWPSVPGPGPKTLLNRRADGWELASMETEKEKKNRSKEEKKRSGGRLGLKIPKETGRCVCVCVCAGLFQACAFWVCLLLFMCIWIYSVVCMWVSVSIFLSATGDKSFTNET